MNPRIRRAEGGLTELIRTHIGQHLLMMAVTTGNREQNQKKLQPAKELKSPALEGECSLEPVISAVMDEKRFGFERWWRC